MMKLTRRNMMKITAAGVAATVLPLEGLAMGIRPKREAIRIALQLYSVRDHCEEDFDKTLEQVAAMGYEGVEFAGYYKYDNKAAELRAKLDSLGLVAAGTHMDADNLDPNKIQKTIDFHAKLGCKYIICPGDDRFTDSEGSKEFAELMNQAAETLKPHGMHCGYHNHSHEFAIVPGTDKTWWDLFAERTTGNVVLQQDVGWATHAKVDAAALIRKYPGRTGITHFKPTTIGEGKQPIIGQDSVPWTDIITACREVGGTKWFTIEQERYLKGKSPMECSELSLKGLQAILAEMDKRRK